MSEVQTTSIQVVSETRFIVRVSFMPFFFFFWFPLAERDSLSVLLSRVDHIKGLTLLQCFDSINYDHM